MDLRSILDGSKIFRQVLGYCAQTNVGSQSSARASQSWPRPPQPPSAAGAIARCFFDFFIPLSAQTPSFESISGRQSSKKALKTRCFTWEGYEKVKQTLHRSEVRATFAVKTHIICTIWNSSADPADPPDPVDPPDPPDQVSESAARTLDRKSVV